MNTAQLHTSLVALHRAMRACEQAPGLDMWAHGEWVHTHYQRLYDALLQGQAPKELQAWFTRALGGDHGCLLSPQEARAYHIYHDCGKPLALKVDEDGRRHFPQHADISAAQYALLFPTDIQTRGLIARDMDFHVARGDAISQAWALPHAPTLYLTAWAEIYANASMFGGEASQSFCIKKSRLVQCGKKAPIFNLTKE